MATDFQLRAVQPSRLRSLAVGPEHPAGHVRPGYSAADSAARACYSSTDWRHCVTQAVNSAKSTALAVDSGLNVDRKSCIQ